VQSVTEDYGVLSDVCTNEKDILIQYCNGCLIKGKLVFKIINCVILFVGIINVQSNLCSKLSQQKFV
jgi:hypothetical protein